MIASWNAEKDGGKGRVVAAVWCGRVAKSTKTGESINVGNNKLVYIK